jgi:formylglycine-generating enzyme required for sulfatase activity
VTPTGLSALARMLPAGPAAADAPTPHRPLGTLCGTAWDDYEIGDLLGAGAMGEVYRARQRSLGRAVALKVLAGGADGAAARRVATEARAAAAIDSPHVVRVHAWGAHGPYLFIALELMEGGALAEALAARRAGGRPWPPAEAVELALAAARGLAAAHAHGLVHRDIKPGNLMLSAAGVLKVADFGLVKVLDAAPLTATGATVGTPLYMSPEQGRGAAVDARSDLYSLGAVLYELLTLRPPFTAEGADGLVFQHNYAEPEPPARLNPDIPADLEALVITCLQKDPSRRYPDAARLVADLERLRGGLAPLSALFDASLGTGAEEALRRAAPRRRWWPLLAAAGALAAALAGGWWWWDARKLAQEQVRRRLAPLAQAAPAPATAGDDLALLARLAGEQDPQVRQGRARLAELEDLRAGLARLEALAEQPTARAEAAAALARLEAASGGADPLLAPWRARLAALAGEEAALRGELAALDREALPAATLRGACAPRLERLERLAGGDDRDLRRWRTAVAAGAAEEARLRARCARLDDPAPLTAAALDELDESLRRLAALAPAGSLAESWAVRVADGRRQRAGLAERLAAALAAPADDRPATAAAREAARQLDALQALDPADARRLAEREAGQQRAEQAAAARRAALAARLAALDLPRTPAAEADRDLQDYEALAGIADGDARRWRARLARIRTLQARLDPLTRRGPPPPAAADDLAALAELAGADDPLVVQAGARLAAIAARRAPLVDTLDRPAPVPADAAARVDAYAALVGDDQPEVRRWRAKLAGWQEAVAALAPLERAWVLDAAALASAERALAAAEAAAGPAATAAWRTRLGELRGPPAPAWAAASGRDRHGPWIEAAPAGAALRLRWVPPGTSWLGSPADEPGRGDDEYLVRVRLTAGRWTAERECSQALWQAVMGGNPALAADPARPVEQVSRADAEAFCARLAALLPGCRARLPSEAEWEAAARAGEPGPWGGLPAHQAAVAIVHQAEGRLAAEPCGGRAANPLGLEDCLGNVWEWVADGYGPHPTGTEVVDPPVPALTGRGVARGGSWADPLASCRAANRVAADPALRSPQLGFRIVVDAAAGDGR